MSHALIKKQALSPIEPVLRKVLMEAENEHRELQEVFDLMGWGDLPEELKIEIKEDIRGFRNELCGNYSTCDRFVLKRRRSIHYWVGLFRAGDCTLKTAVNALRGRPL